MSPRAAQDTAAGRVWSARACGTLAADLDLVIDPSQPGMAIDAVLCACLDDGRGRAPAAAEVAAWTVAQRLDGLLRVRLAGGPARQRFGLRCANASCAAGFEAELDLRTCLRPQDTVASHVGFEVKGRALQARLPTGAEQVRWQRERTPLHLVAAALIEPAPAAAADDATLAALDEALARHDAMRLLRLDLVCPECGVAAEYVVDLEQQLLLALADLQTAWLGDIARLAAAFHWAEADLARLPAWRRRFYLQQVARAAAAGAGERQAGDGA